MTTTLAEVDGAAVVRGGPVRAFPTYKGRRNYPGWLWTATTSSLIGYESLLERDRVWLADFDPSVRWIAKAILGVGTRRRYGASARPRLPAGHHYRSGGRRREAAGAGRRAAGG
jgi:hypothetical protein